MARYFKKVPYIDIFLYNPSPIVYNWVKAKVQNITKIALIFKCKFKANLLFMPKALSPD